MTFLSIKRFQCAGNTVCKQGPQDKPLTQGESPRERKKKKKAVRLKFSFENLYKRGFPLECSGGKRRGGEGRGEGRACRKGTETIEPYSLLVHPENF